MTEKRMVVIKAGDTLDDLKAETGDFEDWIISGLGLAPEAVTVVNAEKGEALPEPERVKGAVISGSHAMVTQELPWSLALEAWAGKIIRAEVPLLGICYGHQIMARAMGGRVEFNPRGTEIGSREIRCFDPCREDRLFAGLPQNFKAHVIHAQSVIRLPEGAVLLAGNDFEPHEALRLGPWAWGVQFHPEADARITLGYIQSYEEALVKEGQDIPALIGTLEETPHAASLLRRFAGLVMER